MASEQIQIVNNTVQKPSEGEYFTGEAVRKFLEISPLSFLAMVAEGFTYESPELDTMTDEPKKKVIPLLVENIPDVSKADGNYQRFVDDIAGMKIHYKDLQTFMEKTANHFLFVNGYPQEKNEELDSLSAENIRLKKEITKLRKQVESFQSKVIRLEDDKEDLEKTNYGLDETLTMKIVQLELCEQNIERVRTELEEARKENELLKNGKIEWYGFIAEIEKMRMEGKTARAVANELYKNGRGCSYAQICALLHPTGDLRDPSQYGKSLVKGDIQNLPW